MPGRNYEKLSIEEFGRHLITSGDLDPVYIALRKVDWTVDKLHRWLIAYWCYYHCGVASYLSDHEGLDFWHRMRHAAVNSKAPFEFERWPRGSERRHFRGTASVNAVDLLKDRYGDNPEGMINYICSDSHVYGESDLKMPFVKISDAAKSHPLFGSWVSFKVADMVDAVLGIPVDFDHAAIFMFKDPVKAAHMVWRKHQGLPDNAQPKNEKHMIDEVVDYLMAEFSDLRCPHANRGIELQEVETCLCKFKSHVNGHYPLYNDIDEITKGLEGWGDMAEEFRAMMPEGSNG